MPFRSACSILSLLVLTSMVACNSGAGSEVVGEWVQAGDPDITFTITKSGRSFQLIQGAKKYKATFSNNTLDAGVVTLTYVAASDSLVSPNGTEFVRPGTVAAAEEPAPLLSALPERSDNAYFVDELTGEESVHPNTSLPPLMGKRGSTTVVRAVKITCDGGKTRTTAYYRKYSADALEKIAELRAKDDPLSAVELEDWLHRGELVRLPERGSPWVPVSSPEGEKILDNAKCENGNAPIPVLPP